MANRDVRITHVLASFDGQGGKMYSNTRNGGDFAGRAFGGLLLSRRTAPKTGKIPSRIVIDLPFGIHVEGPKLACGHKTFCLDSVREGMQLYFSIFPAPHRLTQKFMKTDLLQSCYCYSLSFSVQLVTTVMGEALGHSSGRFMRNRWPSGAAS